ncbi:MAG: ABC transporter permease [Bryobacterales bacterium]|nr:ABC transporter permease [Bryobacterales bacterium]
MAHLGYELWHSLRSLGRQPLFTISAILTLGLAIGAATSVFSVVNGVLLKPVSYPEAGRLALVWETSVRMVAAMGVSEIPVSPALGMEWRERNRVFSQTALFQSATINLTGTDLPERVRGAWVSADMFPLLSVQPQLGRGFTAEDEAESSPPVVILSQTLWHRRFGGRRDVLGSTIRLNDKPYTVVGVMPAGFAFPRGNEYPHSERIPELTELWRPLVVSAAERQNFGNHNSGFVGRLRPGTTLEQAREDLAAIQRGFWEQREPAALNEFGVAPVFYLENMVKKSRPALLLLGGAVLLVMLIACVNVAGLLVVRTIGRRQELAIRVAMGAGTQSIFRLMVIESAILALAGGALGTVFGYWGLLLLRAVGGARIPRIEAATVDPTVLGFALLASLIAACVFAFTLSLANARIHPSEALKEGARTGAGRAQNRIRTALVIGEVAISMVLLTGAGLMMRSMMMVLSADRGFQMDHLLTMQIPLPGYHYPGTEARATFVASLLERIESLPSVTGVAVVNQLPLTGESNIHPLTILGAPRKPGEEPVAEVREVSPAYFSVFGLQMRSGRTLDSRDVATAPQAAVVSESLARRFWPAEDAVGKRFRLGERESLPWVTVVGVVADTRQASLEKEPRPQVFTPWAQRNSSTMALAVRAAGEPTALVNSIRGELARLNGYLPLIQVRTMDEVLASSVEQRRLHTVLLMAFALFALVLVATGLHGVISYTVAQRTREFGVRAAFGAKQVDLFRHVLRQGIRIGVVGLLSGAAGSLLLARFIGSFLYGVSPFDALTYVTVGALTLGITLLATAQPAFRATRVNAVDILREG